MSYFIRYWKEYKDGTIEDGILNIPDDISDEEAKKMIESEHAVKWYISPKIEKKYQEIEELEIIEDKNNEVQNVI